MCGTASAVVPLPYGIRCRAAAFPHSRLSGSTLLTTRPTIQPAADEGIRLGVISTPAFLIIGPLNVGLHALEPPR
jgi:hypothetical protein